MKRIVLNRHFIAMLFLGTLGSSTAIAAPSAPSITSWANGAYINNPAQTIQGSCVSGNSMRIYGQFVGSPVRVDCAGNSYSYSFNFTSRNGAKQINVTATDATGTSAVSRRTLNLDTVAPLAPTVLAPASGSTVSSRNIAIRGGCESGAKVGLSGSLVNSPVVVDCLNGAYAVDVQLTDGNGVKAISASQTDLALNQSVAASLSLNLNVSSNPGLSAPTLAAPAADSYVRVAAQTVSGSCQTGATVNISGSLQSAQTVVCSNGSFARSVNLSTGDGIKTIRVSQTASNVTSAEVSRSLTLDTVAPSAPSVTSPSSGATVSSVSLSVVGGCESGAVVSLSGAVENSPRSVTCANNAYSISATLTSGSGSKALSLSQLDRAGNPSAAQSLSLTLSGSGGGTNPSNFLTIFDCHEGNFVATSDASSAPCAVDMTGWKNPPNGFEIAGSAAQEASVENGKVYLSRGDGGHLGINMVYQRPVNTRAFEATFTFVPSGKNIALVLQNSTYNNEGFNGRNFNSGAGCEGGFFQAYIPDEGAVDKIFALSLMQDMPLLSVNDNPSNDYFTHSSAMIYKSGESPCSNMPRPWWASQTPFSIPTKISTSPVALNYPANRPLTSTGQNYEAKIVYDGSNVTLNLRNLSTGGVCPGANCFSYTWRNVNIPALVGGNTAYVSISAGCNSDCARRVNVNSFKYSAPAN